MTANKELLKIISDINAALTATITDAEKAESAEFYKESIKFAALQIFEKAQLLSDGTRTVVKIPPSEIQPAIHVVTVAKDLTENKKISHVPAVPIVPEAESKPPEVMKDPEPVVVHSKHEPVKQKSAADEIKHNSGTGTDEDTSLNAKIARYQQPVVNIADKLKDTPIKELVKAISISKKFEFIKELFKGNSDVYKNCLNTIENLHSYQEATKYIEDEIAANYNWKESENLAAEFFVLVKRRFL